MKDNVMSRKFRYIFCVLLILCLTLVYIPSSNEVFAANTPSTVSSLKASGLSYNSISVKWKKSASASGYRLYRSTSPKGKYTRLTTLAASDTSYTDAGVITGQKYYYEIRAYKSIGSRLFYGKYSSAVKAVALPGKPQSLAITSEKPGVVHMTWATVDGASGYAVYRRSSTGSYARTGYATETSFTDTGAVQGTKYYYNVRAYMTVNGRNVYGNRSTEQAVTTLSELATPVIDATAYAKKINRVTWAEVEGAEGYVIYSRLSTRSSYSKLATIKTNEYTDSRLLPRTKWFYMVRAYKTNGDGSYTYSAYSTVDSVVTKGHLVFISCGHGIDDKGRWDSGCCYGNYLEAKLMLPITKAMVKYMRSYGVTVITDADKNNNKNVNLCIREANKYPVETYLDIHCDWAGAKSGTQPLYKSAADKKLAKCLNDSVISKMKLRTNGMTYRTDLKGLNNTKAPAACLFETGSIKYDHRVFTKKYDAYGKALAQGLCDYLGVDTTK